MSEQYYLVNKTNFLVILFQGYTSIPAYGFIKVSKEQTTDPTVYYAIGRDWIEISSEEPKKAADAEPITFTVTEPYKGMTLDELKASTPQADAESAPVEPGISTALGVDSTVELKPEPKSRKKAA